MVDYSLVKVIPGEESHREFSYQVTESTMGDYAARILGWDERERRKYHAKDWQTKRPSIIIYDSQPIGTIYILENENQIEIGQFYILPEYQNKGIGSHLLKRVLEDSDKTGLTVKLAVLKVNPAMSLYQRHGFEIAGSNEYQYLMERKPGGKN